LRGGQLKRLISISFRIGAGLDGGAGIACSGGLSVRHSPEAAGRLRPDRVLLVLWRTKRRSFVKLMEIWRVHFGASVNGGISSIGEEAKMAWTDDRVELLKKLWVEGLSARQIADQLGGVTRNAVIGKIHRLGMSGRDSGSHVARKAARPGKNAGKARKAESSAEVTGKAGAGKNGQAAAGGAREEAVAGRENKKVHLEAIAGGIVTPVEELFIPPEDRVTIATIRESQCKWPIGDPASEDFHFAATSAMATAFIANFIQPAPISLPAALPPAARSRRK